MQTSHTYYQPIPSSFYPASRQPPSSRPTPNTNNASTPRFPPSPQYRPAKISELADSAKSLHLDPYKSIKFHLSLGDKLRKFAKQCEDEGDLENAFVYYAKAAYVVADKVPEHRDYCALLTPQRENFASIGSPPL
jgi:STAM-binding protein